MIECSPVNFRAYSLVMFARYCEIVAMICYCRVFPRVLAGGTRVGYHLAGCGGVARTIGARGGSRERGPPFAGGSHAAGYGGEGRMGAERIRSDAGIPG